MGRPPGIVTIGCAAFVAWLMAYVILPPVGRFIAQGPADPSSLVNYDAASVRSLDVE